MCRMSGVCCCGLGKQGVTHCTRLPLGQPTASWYRQAEAEQQSRGNQPPALCSGMCMPFVIDIAIAGSKSSFVIRNRLRAVAMGLNRARWGGWIEDPFCVKGVCAGRAVYVAISGNANRHARGGGGSSSNSSSACAPEPQGSEQPNNGRVQTLAKESQAMYAPRASPRKEASSSYQQQRSTASHWSPAARTA